MLRAGGVIGAQGLAAVAEVVLVAEALALGGGLAGLSILTRTEFLAVILGGLFLAEVISDVVQIASFKSTGRRLLRMAPLHHHFELGGWTEVNVVIRFWIIAGVCVVVGLGLFYAEYLVS